MFKNNNNPLESPEDNWQPSELQVRRWVKDGQVAKANSRKKFHLAIAASIAILGISLIFRSNTPTTDMPNYINEQLSQDAYGALYSMMSYNDNFIDSKDDLNASIDSIYQDEEDTNVYALIADVIDSSDDDNFLLYDRLADESDSDY